MTAPAWAVERAREIVQDWQSADCEPPEGLGYRITAALVEARAGGIEEAATGVKEAWINGGSIETVCDIHHVVEMIRALKAKP